MIRIASAQLWVHDQDEALAFYTEKVGLVTHADVTIPEMGNFRWLSVGPADQTDVSIVLMPIPGPVDEVILLLIAPILFVLYRVPMREAWERAAGRGPLLASRESSSAFKSHRPQASEPRSASKLG